MKVYGEDCSMYLLVAEKRRQWIKLNRDGLGHIFFFYMSEFSVIDALSLVYH